MAMFNMVEAREDEEAAQARALALAQADMPPEDLAAAAGASAVPPEALLEQVGGWDGMR